MNYFLLTSEFPPQYGGGISTYCIETVRMLTSYGHKVTVITQSFDVKDIVKEELQTTNTCAERSRSNKQQTTNYSIYRFNPNQYFTTSCLGYEANLSYAYAQTVKKIIDIEGMPDIIESQEYMGIAYYLLQYKHLNYPIFKDLRVLLTLHAPSFLYFEYNKINIYRFPYFWVGEMEKFCIRAADMLISPSKYLINEIQTRVDISDKTIHIIKNPYQINKPQTSNFKLERSGNPDLSGQQTTNNYVFFGKLTPQKGCLELIEYFKELWHKGFDYKLIMIGGGNHLYHPEGVDMIDFIRKKYKNEINQKRLQLLGSVKPENIRKYTENAKTILIPSMVENLPYTVLESMAQGQIVLASIQGGQSEIIDDEVDGFLFDHNEPNSFANKLQIINSLSKDNIENISKNAQDKIFSNYSYNVIYEQKIKLLNNLINSKIDFTEFPFKSINNLLNNRTIEQLNNRTIEPQTTNLSEAKIPIYRDNKLQTSNFKPQTSNLLSIVIPYYNMGNYIEETIQSILKSTYRNIEIIVVNDGSTEQNSIEKISELEKKYTIQIIHKKNEGLALARNDGAKNAKGKFLAFLDPDDTIEPSYYEKAINVLLNKKNVHFVGCWAKYFGEGKGYWATFNPEPPYLLAHNMINSSALVYKTEDFFKSGLNDPKMLYGMEDYESVINMVKNGYLGVALPEPLWNYRVRKNSMARAFTIEKQLYLYRIIAEKHKDFFSKFGSEISNLINTNGSGISYDNPTLRYNLKGFKFINIRLSQYIIDKLKKLKILRKPMIFINRTIFAKN